MSFPEPSREALLHPCEMRSSLLVSAWRALLLISVAGCLGLLGLSACLSPLTPTPIFSLPTPSPTLTATATIVWFPSTATPTPLPTQVLTPTVDLRPQIGSLLFADQFEDRSAWSLIETQGGRIAFGKNELTIAIAQPKVYLYTLRKSPQLSDFYLQLTLWPNLCRDEDEYGILFRVTPELDFYRLGLTCNGQLHLDRFFQGRVAVPYPKTYSGAVPLGAPSSVRAAIWASEEEIVVFLNDQFQFALRERVIRSGVLGLFARSVSSASVTVNFSDLAVYQIAP
ncbi:MAG: hypothetical protein RML93_08480 [Anaerolineales bacterium]|nr:hypothetical protein [Anaerolineales bacterium]MDW8447312.1 hypothetical protein [Anaerolineales bacterium]